MIKFLNALGKVYKYVLIIGLLVIVLISSLLLALYFDNPWYFLGYLVIIPVMIALFNTNKTVQRFFD
jgi:uncharacterized membrane protein YgaE (UPF0421/DUF939 family)